MLKSEVHIKKTPQRLRQKKPELEKDWGLLISKICWRMF